MEKYCCKISLLLCCLVLAALAVGAELLASRTESPLLSMDAENRQSRDRREAVTLAPDALTSYYHLQSCSGGSINCHIAGNRAGL